MFGKQSYSETAGQVNFHVDVLDALKLYFTISTEPMY